MYKFPFYTVANYWSKPSGIFLKATKAHTKPLKHIRKVKTLEGFDNINFFHPDWKKLANLFFSGNLISTFCSVCIKGAKSK